MHVWGSFIDELTNLFEGFALLNELSRIDGLESDAAREVLGIDDMDLASKFLGRLNSVLISRGNLAADAEMDEIVLYSSALMALVLASWPVLFV